MSQGCKVKISQNIVPKSILRFHIFWNLQYLLFKLLEGFGAKTLLLCKNGSLNCQNSNTLYRFPNFKSLFLKIKFSPICYDILDKKFDRRRQLVPFDVLRHKYGFLFSLFKKMSKHIPNLSKMWITTVRVA